MPPMFLCGQSSSYFDYWWRRVRPRSSLGVSQIRRVRRKHVRLSWRVREFGSTWKHGLPDTWCVYAGDGRHWASASVSGRPLWSPGDFSSRRMKTKACGQKR